MNNKKRCVLIQISIEELLKLIKEGKQSFIYAMNEPGELTLLEDNEISISTIYDYSYYIFQDQRFEDMKSLGLAIKLEIVDNYKLPF